MIGVKPLLIDIRNLKSLFLNVFVYVRKRAERTEFNIFKAHFYEFVERDAFDFEMYILNRMESSKLANCVTFEAKKLPWSIPFLFSYFLTSKYKIFDFCVELNIFIIKKKKTKKK